MQQAASTSLGMRLGYWRKRRISVSAGYDYGENESGGDLLVGMALQVWPRLR